MSRNTPALRRYDTVRIQNTCPIQELHGAKALVAHVLEVGRVLVLFHDRRLQQSHGDLGAYYRTHQRHLENLNVPIYPIPKDDPFMYLPEIEKLVETLPARERLPHRRPCPICPNEILTLYTKNGRWWYSHKRPPVDYIRAEDWCRGYRRWFESAP